MTAPLDEQGMRERHREGAVSGTCVCGARRWPCDAIKALDEMGEARRDHASIIDATKAAGIGWRENEDGAETCHNVRAEALEAALAAKTAALERAARNLHEAAGLLEETPRRDMAQFVHGSSADALAALASSPGAAWLTWAREAVEALDELISAVEDGERRAAEGDGRAILSNMIGATKRQARALLARAPEGLR